MLLHLFAGKKLAGRMNLPAPPREAKQLLEEIRAASQSASPITIYNLDSVIPGLGWHLQYAEVDDSALQKLNHLAEAIDQMEAAGLHDLTKALSTDCQQNLDDIFRITFDIVREQREGYEFIPAATTDYALGNWLVEQGRFEIQEHLRPHLNYESVGREYRLEHDGVFLTNGYAGIQTGTFEQENGEQGIFQITLCTNQNTACLCLPASGERLEQVKEQLGVDDFCQTDVLNIKAHDRMACLMDLLPKGLVTVEELDALAECLQTIEQEDGDILKYCAVLEAENPITFSEAVTIAMDIDDYERIPEDMNEYGKQVLRRTGADDEVIDAIDGYMDFAQLGKDTMQEEGVRQTEFGLVRRISSPFPVESMEQTMC